MICRRCLHTFTKKDKVRTVRSGRSSVSVHADTNQCKKLLAPYKGKGVRNEK